MNYYEILHVSKTASQADIRDSYKKLIKQYHPDLYSGSKKFAETKTKELNDAYAILSNDDARRAYDISLNPTASSSTSTSKAHEYVNYKPYQKTEDYVEKPHDTIDEMLKKKVHNVVDTKLNNLNSQETKALVASIIIIAVIFTFLTMKDYVDLVHVRQANEKARIERQREIMDSYYKETLMSDDIEAETETEIETRN